MTKRTGGVLVSTRRILRQPEKPIVPSGWIGVEAKGLAQIVDALDSASLERPQLSQEGPGVGMIGIDSQRCRQFRSTFLRASGKDQHIGENRMRHGIFRI